MPGRLHSLLALAHSAPHAISAVPCRTTPQAEVAAARAAAEAAEAAAAQKAGEVTVLEGRLSRLRQEAQSKLGNSRRVVSARGEGIRAGGWVGHSDTCGEGEGGGATAHSKPTGRSRGGGNLGFPEDTLRGQTKPMLRF